MRKLVQNILISTTALAVLSLALAGGSHKGPKGGPLLPDAHPEVPTYSSSTGYHYLNSTEEVGRSMIPKWVSMQW